MRGRGGFGDSAMCPEFAGLIVASGASDVARSFRPKVVIARALARSR
jgi:hypothetical protein